MTVTVFPYARSPYGKILLYTPMFSRHFTIASGVQGRMDLMWPGGGVSAVVVGTGAAMEALEVAEVDGAERKVRGLTYRMLRVG